MDEHRCQELGGTSGKADLLRRPTRGMTLADLMILVTAAGAALWVLRVLLREFRESGSATPTLTAGMQIWIWVMRSVPFLAAAGPALLLIRLQRPRPRRRRVFRLPGTVACLVVTLCGSLSVLSSAARLWVGSTSVSACVNSLSTLGREVLVVWLALGLAGVWRPAPDWIDRSGRAIGVTLIAIYALVLVLANGLWQ